MIKKRNKIFLNLFIFSFIFTGICFAHPRIKITSPKEGAIVHPGEELTVNIKAANGFKLKEGTLGVFNEPQQYFTSLPATVKFIVPLEAAGNTTIVAFATDTKGRFTTDRVKLMVKQNAALESLEVSPEELFFETDRNGNIKENYYPYINVNGIYSDGIKRHITQAHTTYASSDASVISVDTNGKVKALKVGEATIIVSNSRESKIIPVVFKKPYGIFPKETIAPTTQIVIQPHSNKAGWYNTDVHVTVTAVDNEEGSGIQEILYQLNNLGPQENYIETDTLRLLVSGEGYDRLNYVAKDKERNGSIPKTVEFYIDKTPPKTRVSITPKPDRSGIIRSLPVKLHFTATDNLSGVAFTTEDKIIAKPGIYKIRYYSKDIAGNKEETKTLTIKIKLKHKNH